MSVEYAEAAKKAKETNPLQLSNLFHLVVGSISILCGILMAFLLTRQLGAPQATLFYNLMLSALLIVIGLRKIGQSWRDEKFRFHPDDIGEIGTPEKFAKDGTLRVHSYLYDVLNNGVVPPGTPENPLLRKLYNAIPKLEFAPEIIRWHAETQALRIAHLLVATLGFGLAAVFAEAAVFAWMAPLYLWLVVRPLGMVRGMFKGTSAAEQTVRPEPPKPLGFVAVIFLSIFVPIFLGLVPEGVLPVFPFATSTVVVPTVIGIVGMLLASTLFIMSLKLQTRDLSTSGVGHNQRDDLNVSSVSSGLIETLLSKLPFPRRLISEHAGWKDDKGSFGGALLLETEPSLNEAGSGGGKIQAVGAGWADPEQRPLVMLGLLGALTGVLAPAFVFAFMLGGRPVMVLSALALFSASEFALFASRGLWNRLDFTSTLFKVHFRGNYTARQSVKGNSVTGSGSLSETTTDIDNVMFNVCVARIESVAFSKKGARYIQSVDLKKEKIEWVYDLITDYYGGVNRRRLNAYQNEGTARHLVGGSASAAPAEVALLGRAPADGAQPSSPIEAAST